MKKGKKDIDDIVTDLLVKAGFKEEDITNDQFIGELYHFISTGLEINPNQLQKRVSDVPEAITYAQDNKIELDTDLSTFDALLNNLSVLANNYYEAKRKDFSKEGLFDNE